MAKHTDSDREVEKLDILVEVLKVLWFGVDLWLGSGDVRFLVMSMFEDS